MPTDAARFDSPPTTEEGRHALLTAIIDQSSEVYKQTGHTSKSGVKVTCPCGRQSDVLIAHRCYHCGLYFCRRCCERHFGAQPTVIEDPSRPELQ